MTSFDLLLPLEALADASCLPVSKFITIQTTSYI